MASAETVWITLVVSVVVRVPVYSGISVEVVVSVTVTVEVVDPARWQLQALLTLAEAESHSEKMDLAGSTEGSWRFWNKVVVPAVSVTVAVVKVTTAVTVSKLVWVEVTVSTSVTTVVAGVQDSHDEQKASPMLGTAVMAARH